MDKRVKTKKIKTVMWVLVPLEWIELGKKTYFIPPSSFCVPVWSHGGQRTLPSSAEGSFRRDCKIGGGKLFSVNFKSCTNDAVREN